MPLLPLWVRTALVGFDARLLLLYPLGGTMVVGVHLVQALPDAATDSAAAVRNRASVLGERRVILVCWAATLSALSLALLAASALAE